MSGIHLWGGQISYVFALFFSSSLLQMKEAWLGVVMSQTYSLSLPPLAPHQLRETWTQKQHFTTGGATGADRKQSSHGHFERHVQFSILFPFQREGATLSGKVFIWPIRKGWLMPPLCLVLPSGSPHSYWPWPLWREGTCWRPAALDTSIKERCHGS